MRRYFIALLIALLAIIPIGAAEMNATVRWELDDGVIGYRYRLDKGEWTAVSPETSQVTLTGLDSETEYLFYLESSYDGEVWSDPAIFPINNKPIEHRYQAEAYSLDTSVVADQAYLGYPEEIGTEDMADFLRYIDSKFHLAASGIEYSIASPGLVVISYPQTMAPAEAEMIVEEIADEFVAFSEDEDYADQSNPTAASVRDPLDFAFRLGVDIGASTSFDDSFHFDKIVFFNFSLAFDFTNVISLGNIAGIGFRLDLGIDAVPPSGTWSFSNLSFSRLASIGSLDFLVIFDFPIGNLLFNLGGGVGLKGAAYADVLLGYLSLGSFSMAGTEYFYDWYAAATLGIGYRFSKLFSLSVELDYNYIVGSKTHFASVAAALGFTF